MGFQGTEKNYSKIGYTLSESILDIFKWMNNGVSTWRILDIKIYSEAIKLSGLGMVRKRCRPCTQI